MSLIKCTECGSQVSDKAENCPNCGCPVTAILQEINEQRIGSIDYEIDNDRRFCKACLNCGAVYANPNADGYKNGYCIECRHENLYDKLQKIDYTIAEFNSNIPKQPDSTDIYKNSFIRKAYYKKFEEWKESIVTEKRKLYERYVSHWTTIDKECHTYKLNMETLYHNSHGEAHDEISRRVQQNVSKQAGTFLGNKCPRCGSGFVKEISTASRMISIFGAGLASSKIGKQYECTKCKYKW